MKATTTTNGWLFPTDYVSKAEKSTDEYSLLWLRAIQQQIRSGNVEVSARRNAELRSSLAYYHGNQSTYKYMQDFGLKQDEQGNLVGFTDLDWTPVGFMRTFIKSIYAYMTKERYDYEARGLDDNSIREKEAVLFRKKILMRDRATFERIMGRPITEYVPASEAEFHVFAEEGIKSTMEIVFEKHLQAVLQENRMDLRIEKNLITDLIYSNYFAVMAEYSPTGRINLEWVDTSELYFPRSKERDFSDIPWVARVRLLTIQQLKSMVKDRQLSNEEWEKIAQQYGRKGPGDNTDNSGAFMWPGYDNNESEGIGRYGGRYDHFAIPVMQAYRLSTDYAVLERYPNSFNGDVIYRSRPFDFKPSDPKRRVDKEYINVYGALWLIGSDHVFNVGQVSNLIRPHRDRSRPMLPIMITKTHSDSLAIMRSCVETLKPIEHLLQNAWMKLQNELAAAKPDITYADIRWLMNGIQLGVEAKDIQEAVDAALQGGTALGTFSDDATWAARPGGGSGPPFGRVPGGLGQAFRGYVETLQLGFMIMERVVGRSPIQIGQTPHPDTGKRVMEMTITSANEMLQDMVDAYQLGIHNMVEYVSEMIMRLADYRTADEEIGYRQVFSKLTNSVLNAAKGMHLRTMGIQLQKRMTEAEVMEVLQDLQDMRNARNARGNIGGITEDEYLEIRDLLRQNPREARRRLRFRATRRVALEQALAEQNARMNAEVQQQAIAAKMQADAQAAAIAENEKRQTMQLEYNLKRQLMKDELQQELAILREKARLVKEQSAQDFREDVALQSVDNSNDKLFKTQSSNNTSASKI